MTAAPGVVKVRVLGLAFSPCPPDWEQGCGPHPGSQARGLLEPGSTWRVGLGVGSETSEDRSLLQDRGRLYWLGRCDRVTDWGEQGTGQSFWSHVCSAGCCKQCNDDCTCF